MWTDGQIRQLLMRLFRICKYPKMHENSKYNFNNQQMPATFAGYILKIQPGHKKLPKNYSREAGKKEKGRTFLLVVLKK